MTMNYEALIPQNTAEYLERFTRTDYPTAYKRYTDSLSGFLTELRGCENLSAAADGAAEYMAGRIKGLWKKRKLIDMKYFLIMYVSPALLAEETGVGRSFAEELRRSWLKGYPDEGYDMGSFEELSAGFNDTVLGFRFNNGGKK